MTSETTFTARVTCPCCGDTKPATITATGKVRRTRVLHTGGGLASMARVEVDAEDVTIDEVLVDGAAWDLGVLRREGVLDGIEEQARTALEEA